jgi:hypothetical protein
MRSGSMENETGAMRLEEGVMRLNEGGIDAIVRFEIK